MVFTLGFWLIVALLWAWWYFAMFSDSGLGEIARQKPLLPTWNWSFNYDKVVGVTIPGFAVLLTGFGIYEMVGDLDAATFGVPTWLARLINGCYTAAMVASWLGLPAILIGLLWPTKFPWWADPHQRWLRRQEAQLDPKQQTRAEAEASKKFTADAALRADQITPANTAHAADDQVRILHGTGEASGPFLRVLLLGLGCYFARYIHRLYLDGQALATADRVHYLLVGAIFGAGIYYFTFHYRSPKRQVRDIRAQYFDALDAKAKRYYAQLPHSANYYRTHRDELDETILPLEELVVLELKDREAKALSRQVASTYGEVGTAIVECAIMAIILAILPLYGINVLEWLFTAWQGFDL
ncbi:MAG: hypothetical protein Q4Q03_00785 [Bowdeniella nasicola]|nr:hypothetical protein [Bowdeniella nasicola]